MSRAGRELRDYVADIGEAAARIADYVSGLNVEAFAADRLRQDAVIRNLEIIGEASQTILRHWPDFAEANPDLELREAYAMRNAIAHGYFRVSAEIVWTTVVKDIPAFAAAVERAGAAHAASRQSPRP